MKLAKKILVTVLGIILVAIIYSVFGICACITLPVTIPIAAIITIMEAKSRKGGEW